MLASAITGALVVTGTDTGVGKTIATAAISAAALAGGLRVAVVKPAQTGLSGVPQRAGGQEPARPGLESDAETVVRLAAPTTARTLASYPHPLAPLVAARVAGLAPLELTRVETVVRELVPGHDLVVIEGAGGLLVPMGAAGSGEAWTIADLAVAARASVVVVTRASLGTLNHTALTLESLANRGLDALVVIGEWPTEPELVHRTNAARLPGVLAGVLPERASRLAAARFRTSAPAWLTPALHGHFDADGFRASAVR